MNLIRIDFQHMIFCICGSELQLRFCGFPGSVICTKAGVVNLGLEGIMLISALAGVLGSAFGGSLWIGLLTGLLASVAVSAVFAYFHLALKANNVLCGTAVNTMASGLTVFVLQLATGEKGNSSSLKSFSFPNVDIPIIKDIPVLGGIYQA